MFYGSIIVVDIVANNNVESGFVKRKIAYMNGMNLGDGCNR